MLYTRPRAEYLRRELKEGVYTVLYPGSGVLGGAEPVAAQNSDLTGNLTMLPYASALTMFDGWESLPGAEVGAEVGAEAECRDDDNISGIVSLSMWPWARVSNWQAADRED